MTRNMLGICAAVLFCSSCAVAQSAPPDTGAAPATSAPAAATGVTSADPTEVARFQKLEDNWSTAVNTHDQYALELVLSPLFVDISGGGDITTRNQQLAWVISAEDKSTHLEQRVITVRMLGDTAIANGTYLFHHKTASTQVDERGIFTHVFERHRNGWLCVNSQRTVIRDEGSGAKKKKQSDAEMPFHIPLFSKGDKKDQ